MLPFIFLNLSISWTLHRKIFYLWNFNNIASLMNGLICSFFWSFERNFHAFVLKAPLHLHLHLTKSFTFSIKWDWIAHDTLDLSLFCCQSMLVQGNIYTQGKVIIPLMQLSTNSGIGCWWIENVIISIKRGTKGKQRK